MPCYTHPHRCVIMMNAEKGQASPCLMTCLSGRVVSLYQVPRSKGSANGGIVESGYSYAYARAAFLHIQVLGISILQPTATLDAICLYEKQLTVVSRPFLSSPTFYAMIVDHVLSCRGQQHSRGDISTVTRIIPIHLQARESHDASSQASICYKTSCEVETGQEEHLYGSFSTRFDVILSTMFFHGLREPVFFGSENSSQRPQGKMSDNADV